MKNSLITLEDVSLVFARGWPSRERVEAVAGVSLNIPEGGILALVGETGSGKTTLGKLVAGLYRPTRGRVLFRGQDLRAMDRRTFLEYRRAVQLVHQDAFAALNPVRTIYHSLKAPLLHHRLARTERDAREQVAALLTQVGLTPPELFLDKYPHQLSGGQRQRVLLARALTVQPRLIVADEPVSMVDVSLRLSILQLLRELNRRLGIAILYITHDLATARYLAEDGQLAVMYLGKIVEHGTFREILGNPRHPYLQALLSAVPIPDPRSARSMRPMTLQEIDPPDPRRPPSGCRFHPRCPYARPICREIPPALEGPVDHRVACHFAAEIPPWHPLSAASPSQWA
ncbi:MAG: ABC transporter ATP-binding protein [Thermoflexus hugenholtzii]|uniref:ABC transporter ATP-binding protein n=1 Tax=Thermoflexus TaxID=1495649 RepID=UPI001C787898|nr:MULTISPECIES: ABC transporter ATP-binding protein [Thermoflexus]QWK10424.1 MAG: ABC transporter ATP-binding protein [Thermoflexus hugenholtzii]